jgi:hypothetical protein
MALKNLLFGQGERLFTDGIWKRGPGDKPPPYTIEQQRSLFHDSLQAIASVALEAPRELAPRGEVCAKITLHPQFLAKSYFPDVLLRQSGLRLVGSRATELKPRAMARGAVPVSAATAVLIVAGTSDAFAAVDEMLMSDAEEYRRRHLELTRLEGIELFRSADRLRIDVSSLEGWGEVLLHASVADDDIRAAFARLAEVHGAELTRSRVVGGLTFAPLRIPEGNPENLLRVLGEFSHLRTLRNMPKLSLEDLEAETAPQIRVANQEPPTHEGLRTVIFDGGFPAGHLPWVRSIDAPGVPSATPSLKHGTNVTSAFLFGPNHPGDQLPKPYCDVDHVRVLPSSDGSVHASDVIDRVVSHLKRARDNGEEYELANLSLGPRVPILDDDPHEWTVRLDDFLALGDLFLTVAVGNDGTEGPDVGRIQPPSDAVNAFSVGSCVSEAATSACADYSCHGQGRSPGLIKPDALAFGGCDANPLVLFDPVSGGHVLKKGTSYAAPQAMRLAAAIRAHVDLPIKPIMLHALLASSASFSPRHHKQRNCGWGVLPAKIQDLMYSPSDEVVVMYQGEIQEGKPIRARIPLPPGLPLDAKVSITATFAYRTPIDPSHPVNYTQAGLEVRFQPDGIESVPFFGNGIFDSEQELRRDALKWETCRKKRKKFQAGQLVDPSFLISYQTREEGHPRPKSTVAGEDVGIPMPFALVIRIRVIGDDLIAEKVAAAYEVLQHVPLRAQVQIET